MSEIKHKINLYTKVARKYITDLTNKIEDWSSANNLMLNTDKSKAMNVMTYQRRTAYDLHCNNPIYSINHQEICYKAAVKLLGVIFNQNLTWRNQF